MFHTAVYNATAATALASNVDFSAAVDPIWSQRNSHYLWDVPVKLGRILAVGASLTRGQLLVQSWLGYTGQPDLVQVNRSATVPSNPQYDDWMETPLLLPMNEEFKVQYSNNLASGTEVETAIVQLLSADWNRNRGQGPFMGVIDASFTVTPTANAWGGLGTLTLTSNIRNGVWEVYDAVVQGTNSAAWRLVFPTQRQYAGKFFRPGGPVQNAVGDVLPCQHGWRPGFMGVLGRFHSSYLPQIEFFGLTASSTTYRVFLYATYLGEDFSLLSQWAAGGSPQVTI